MSYPGGMSHSFGSQIIKPLWRRRQTGLKQLGSKENNRVVFIFNPFHVSTKSLEP